MSSLTTFDGVPLQVYEDIASGSALDCRVIALTWLLWDCLITFSDEVEHIWSQPWTLLKVLFLLARYGGLIVGVVGLLPILLTGIPRSSCFAFALVTFAGSSFLLVTVQVVLQYRIYIIYNKSRFLLRVNVVLFVLSLAAGAAMLFYYGGRLTPVPDVLFAIGACYDIRPHAYGAALSPALAFEVYLVVLAIIKAHQERRSIESLGKSSILGAVVHGNVIYFVLTASFLLINIFLWTMTVSPNDAGLALINASGVIGSARLILRTRSSTSPLPTSVGQTLDSIEFASNEVEMSHNV